MYEEEDRSSDYIYWILDGLAIVIIIMLTIMIFRTSQYNSTKNQCLNNINFEETI